MTPYRLYSMRESGNCWKPRVLMHRLGIPFEIIDKDILKGETRTADFTAMNPNGRVPTLELPDGRYLAESNAVLAYLAEGTDMMPADRYDRAVAFQWMFFEQYSHEPYIAVARYWRHVRGEEPPGHMVETLETRGHQALAVMETHLSAHDFFAAGHYSIADIALYAYTHVAPEGGFSLDPYPAVRTWLKRVEATEGFVPLDWRP